MTSGLLLLGLSISAFVLTWCLVMEVFLPHDDSSAA
jgi:hypothetical protein